MTMRTTIALFLLCPLVAGCATPGANPAARGLEPVNQPVLERETFAFDAAAPGGLLPASEVARLDAWFQSLGLAYGDSIFVDGDYAASARQQVAALAGNYGLMVQPAAPVTTGAVVPGTVRVVVARTRAEVPGCPNWRVPSEPNTDNAQPSNYGCAVNSNMAMMVADPQDLFHGRDVGPAIDNETASKAIQYYRNAPPSATEGLQNVNTKKGN